MEATNVTRTILDFTAYKGDTFDAVLSFVDANEDPLDLTGCEFEAHIRRSTDQLVKTMKTTGPSPELVLVTNVLTFNAVLDIAAEEYKWDVQCIFADGKVKTFAGGKMTIVDEVTHEV